MCIPLAAAGCYNSCAYDSCAYVTSAYDSCAYDSCAHVSCASHWPQLVGTEHTVLVHGKVGLMAGRAIELTVRTRDPRFTDALQRQLVEAIQGRRQ